MNRVLTLTLGLAMLTACPSPSRAPGATDGGGDADAGIIPEIHVASPYSSSGWVDAGFQTVSSESRVYALFDDGGVAAFSRPPAPSNFAGGVPALLSRDRAYLYDATLSDGVRRTADGQQTVKADALDVSNAVLGQVGGSLVVFSSHGGQTQLVSVPLDGATAVVLDQGLTSEAFLFRERVIYTTDLGTFVVSPTTKPQKVGEAGSLAAAAAPGVYFINNHQLVVDLSQPSLTPSPLGASGSLVVSTAGALGSVRYDEPSKTMFFQPNLGGEEHAGYVVPTARSVGSWQVIASRLVAWSESDQAASRFFVAEPDDLAHPLEVASQLTGAKQTTSARRWYVGTSTSLAEVDFVERKASETIQAPLARAVLFREALIYLDSSSRLWRKPFGAAATPVANQACMLLTLSSARAIHQCADGVVYALDDTGAQHPLLGLEVASNEYALDSYHDVFRYLEPIAQPGTGRAWVYDLAQHAVLVDEVPTQFYRYRFVADHYVRNLPTESRLALYDLQQHSNTLGPRGFVYPTTQDTGSVLFGTLPTDGGSRLVAYDVRTSAELPVEDAGMFTRGAPFRASSYVGAAQTAGSDFALIERGSGRLVSLPKSSDGGQESYQFLEVPRPDGGVLFSGLYGVYDERLRVLVDDYGYKQYVVDPATSSAYFQSSGQLPDGGRGSRWYVVRADGGVGAVTNAPSGAVTSGQFDPVFFVRDADALSTFDPTTSSLTQRGTTSTYPVDFPGGFLLFEHGDLRAFDLSSTDTAGRVLNAPGELVLDYHLNAQARRVVMRVAHGDWRHLAVVSYDLVTHTHSVLYEPSDATKIGTVSLSADGRFAIFTTSSWAGTSSALVVRPL